MDQKADNKSTQQAQEQQQSQYADYFQDVAKPIPEELVYSWNAPSRPFKKKNRQYFTTVLTIATLLSLILFFAGQALTVAVVIAVVFLGYVLSTVPPHTIENKITTYGVRTDENLYFWEELGRFWFDKKGDEKILHIEVARFPHRLALLLGKTEEKLLEEILSEVLLKEKPQLTSTEKFAEWLKKKIPLDFES